MPCVAQTSPRAFSRENLVGAIAILETEISSINCNDDQRIAITRN